MILLAALFVLCKYGPPEFLPVRAKSYWLSAGGQSEANLVYLDEELKKADAKYGSSQRQKLLPLLELRWPFLKNPETAFQAKDIEELLSSKYENAIDSSKKSRLLTQLALFYIVQQKDYKKAEPLALEAEKLAPGQAFRFHEKAYTYCSNTDGQEENPQLVADLERLAIVGNKKEARFYANLAMAQNDLGQFAQAEQTAERGLSLEKNSGALHREPDLHTTLLIHAARASFCQKDFIKSAQYATEAITSNKLDTEKFDSAPNKFANILLIESLIKQGQMGKALGAANASTMRFGDESDILALKYYILKKLDRSAGKTLEEGDMARARQDFDRQAEKDLRAGDLGSALLHAEIAAAVSADDTYALLVRAKVKNKLGQHKEALADLRNSLNLNGSADQNQAGKIYAEMVMSQDSLGLHQEADLSRQAARKFGFK